jgi:hypothetical protein
MRSLEKVLGPWGINPSFPGLSPSQGHVIHVLLTRAPLDRTSIATYPIPCDLHVLNTPPAFVLSQNQTLRKKTVWRNPGSHRETGCVNQIDLGGQSTGLPRHFRPPFPRMPALQATRSAQFNLFFLFPAFTGVTAPSRARCHHRSPIWHAPCWATLSKIPASRGLKSRPGELPSSSTTIDFRVSRPPSSVAARDATPCRSTQSIHFLNFLRFFSRGIICVRRRSAQRAGGG